MLAGLVSLLICPVCSASLREDEGNPSGRTARCPSEHRFDLARQGHLTLLHGAHRHPGDDATMVGHRVAFLEAGHYLPIARRLSLAAAEVAVPGIVLDIGGGPGWYSARLLEELPDRRGVTFDASTAAARRAARAHPRLASVVADGWSAFPVGDGSTAVALSVFAPRQGEQICRVLAPGGVLLTVTPTSEHLAQVRGVLGLLDIAPDKETRLASSLSGLSMIDQVSVSYEMSLGRADVEHLALMGPSAFHVSAGEMADRVAGLPSVTEVTCDVVVGVYRTAGSESPG